MPLASCKASPLQHRQTAQTPGDGAPSARSDNRQAHHPGASGSGIPLELSPLLPKHVIGRQNGGSPVLPALQGQGSPEAWHANVREG